MRVGVVLGDDGTGAPWNYIKKLTFKLATNSDIVPVALYTGDSPDKFPKNAEVINYSSYSPFPSWHTVAQEYNLDLFHLNGMPRFGHWPSFRSEIPVVVTVHGAPHWLNLSPDNREMKGFAAKKFDTEFRWRDRMGKYNVDAVFTVSNSLKNTYVDTIGYSEDRVFTTYEGVDDIFYELEPTTKPKNVPTEYLLHVSSSSRIKNVETIIKSLGLLLTHNNQNLHLIIAGEGWKERLSNIVNEYEVSNNTIFTGYVSTNRLITLYDHATCFVFPSFNESFGLPNVESMARGTPVVASDRRAIPEIVGDAGLLINNPSDHHELYKKINRILSNKHLTSQLVKEGKEQAERFRWSAHISRIESVYSTVLDKNNL